MRKTLPWVLFGLAAWFLWRRRQSSLGFVNPFNAEQTRALYEAGMGHPMLRKQYEVSMMLAQQKDPAYQAQLTAAQNAYVDSQPNIFMSSTGGGSGAAFSPAVMEAQGTTYEE